MNNSVVLEDVNLELEEEIAKANGQKHSAYFYLQMALDSEN